MLTCSSSFSWYVVESGSVPGICEFNICGLFPCSAISVEYIAERYFVCVSQTTEIYFSCNYGYQKSKIKVLAGLISSEASPWLADG
jgi:hypothetical protein